MSLARKLVHLQAALAFQWLPPAVVRAIQLRRLKAMLRFCERAVPLYRETFRKAGVRADDLRRLEDLARFPTLTREQLCAAYPDGVQPRRPKEGDVVFRTSGTSGLFMEIAYSAEAADLLDAVYLRALLNAGYRPWQKLAYFWWESEAKPLKPYERVGLMRKAMVPVDPDPRVQLGHLRRLRPEVIYHFPSSMGLLAQLVLEEGLGDLRPRTIICHGELLPEETRQRISSAFQCPVFNQYGAQEFNRLGWDCHLHRGLHLDADSVVLEVLDGDRPAAPGVEGELVFTGLVNRLMPLVRYRIGDVGRLEEGRCGCGRGLPLYQVTEGRRDDVLRLPGGRRVGPRTLAPRIEELRGFTQYRVIQEEPDRVKVLLVKEPGANGVEATVSEVVRRVLGADIAVEVQAVPEIPLSRRGKLRKVVCQLRS
jgi:phenylacetate-CoA ligase